MDSQMYQNLRRLINVVDELRDVGLQQYINLPRICVVGTQSSGKSSVLESIVGMDFLPRGEGICTRRPLELRLVHLSESEHKLEEAWALFEGTQKKYTHFEQVRGEIERLTDEVAGKNKGIVDEPIVLTVYATQCPDLTLIDLPGITRVPMKGSDQTDDIEKLTREMALRYVRDPRTIILAVMAANADLSTSDALQLARKVDPKGLRTIGVITKIDLMDRGTDATKMLLGEDVPLRLGYTGVKNRSQADIKGGKKVREALEEEKTFFQNHPTYRALPPHYLGSRSLVDKLTKVLFRHIRNFLPEIKREINNKARSVSMRLDELGEGVPVDVAERVQLMWTMITDYCEIFKNTIRGKFDRKLQNYFEHQDLTGGAQIRTIFNDLLEEYVEKDVTADMTDYDIDSAIRMHEGDSIPGFPSPDTFEYLILPHLRKVHAPVLECLDRVSQTLELLSQKIANRVFSRFPKLAEQVLEQTQTIMLREKDTVKTILENLVAAETGYLFTNDSKYLMDHGSMLPMHNQEMIPQGPGGYAMNAEGQPIQHMGQIHPSNPNPRPGEPRSAQAFLNAQQQAGAGGSVFGRERNNRKTRYSGPFIKEIRKRLDSYFAIVLRNIRDTVPKTVGFFLVRQIQEKLQFELYTELNKAEILNDLLGEPPYIVEERKSLTLQMDVLKKASQVLQRDPTIAALNLEGFDHEYETDFHEEQLRVQAQAEAAGRGKAPHPFHPATQHGGPPAAAAAPEHHGGPPMMNGPTVRGGPQPTPPLQAGTNHTSPPQHPSPTPHPHQQQSPSPPPPQQQQQQQHVGGAPPPPPHRAGSQQQQAGAPGQMAPQGQPGQDARSRQGAGGPPKGGGLFDNPPPGSSKPLFTQNEPEKKRAHANPLGLFKT